MGTKVRLSVANLAAYVINSRSGEIAAIGIFNKKKYERGFGILQALGGAAKLTPLGKEMFVSEFGAEFAPDSDEKSDDARFVIDADYLEEAIKVFEDCEDGLAELDTSRELMEELVNNPIGGSPILSYEDIVTAKSEILTVCRQVPADDGVGASENASKEVPTRRLFYVHVVTLSPDAFDRLLASPYIRRLSHEELRSTEMGRKKGQTTDGITLADNLCDYVLDVALE